jgi:hypothetical protein
MHWFVAFGVALLVGCSPGPDASTSEEQLVRERAEERWRALVEGDFQHAYGFESPAYRALTPYASFRAQFGGAAVWKGAQVSSVTMREGGDAASVVMTIDYLAVLPSGETYPGRRGMKEEWIKSAGDWWIVTQ